MLWKMTASLLLELTLRTSTITFSTELSLGAVELRRSYETVVCMLNKPVIQTELH